MAARSSSELAESVEAILDAKPSEGLTGAEFYAWANGMLERLGGVE